MRCSPPDTRIQASGTTVAELFARFLTWKDAGTEQLPWPVWCTCTCGLPVYREGCAVSPGGCRRRGLEQKLVGRAWEGRRAALLACFLVVLPIPLCCEQAMASGGDAAGAGAGPEAAGWQESLIPGLPEEVAFKCLTHVPRRCHRVMRRVCKQWDRLLDSDEFFEARSKAKLAEPWIHVLTRIQGSRNPWRAFDLHSRRWIKFPDLPSSVYEKLSLVGLQCQVVKGKLVLCGGRWQGSIIKDVLVYDPRTDRWREGEGMLSHRADFVSGVIEDQLYVAGGNNGVQGRTRSVERYDIEQNRWFPAPSMNYDTAFCLGVTLDDKLFVHAKGGLPEETQVFCPFRGLWSSFEAEMLTSHRIHPYVVSNGQLYRADMLPTKFEIKAYDVGSDTWISMKPTLTIFQPTKYVKELVDLDQKLGIVMDDFSVAVVEIDLPNHSLKYQWFYLTAANPSTDRIVSCHVLYA